MKKLNLINIEFITLIILILIWIWSTNYVISKQTDRIADKVTQNILQIEYNKVWGEENFKKLNKIQQKQIEGFLKQYDSQKSLPSTNPSK